MLTIICSESNRGTQINGKEKESSQEENNQEEKVFKEEESIVLGS